MVYLQDIDYISSITCRNCVNQDFTEYTNLEECISYLCEYITSKGPFDGFLGFSQVCIQACNDDIRQKINKFRRLKKNIYASSASRAMHP